MKTTHVEKKYQKKLIGFNNTPKYKLEMEFMRRVTWDCREQLEKALKDRRAA